MLVGVDTRDLVVSITGMGRYIFKLMVHMAPLDLDIDYILYTHKSIENFPFDKHKNIKGFVSTGPLGMFASPREIWKQFWMPYVARRDRLDVFFIPSNTVPIFAPCPTLVTVHDVIYARHPEWGTFKERAVAKLAVRFARRADLIIVPSWNTRKDLLELGNCPPEKINVIPHGLTFDFSTVADKPRAVPSGTAPFLLFVGFDYPRRDIPGLIKAFGAAMEVCESEYHLILAGGTNRKSILIQDIERAGMVDRVHILDHTDDETLSYLYTHAYAFIYPSRYEGFGIPVLEAMTAGLPVIVPQSPPMPEVAGEAGIYFEPDDPEGMKKAILKIIQNPNLREEFSAKSKIQASRFDWKETASKTLELIKQLGDKTAPKWVG